MKTVVRRIRKLEVARFRCACETMRKDSDLSADEAVVQMLAAGDWQCALELLEQGEGDVWHQRELIEHWRAGTSGLIDIDFRDLTRLRQTLENSLADLPPELRWTIARRLLEADTERE